MEVRLPGCRIRNKLYATTNSPLVRSAKVKVLIIEDDPDVLDVISLCVELRWPDAVVWGAPDGATGLATVARENIDAVILDLGLPDVGGLEVCRKLRQESSVPIIMLTAQSQPTAIVRGLETGADAVVTKPFNHLELMARVQALLRRGRGDRLHDNENNTPRVQMDS